MKQCLCIDVGGTSIKYGVINENKEITHYHQVETPYDGLENYLNLLVSIYKPYKYQVDGISLSLPGIIDSENGLCITGGSLTFADDLYIVSELKKGCHTEVKIMNDAKAAALAEVGWGSLSGVNDAVVLVFGTAIGGAIIKDKNIHNGKHFSAGEFSYLICGSDVSNPDDLWWGINGNAKLRSQVAELKNLDKETITGYDVFKYIEENDSEVVKVFDQFTKHIAKMIMNIQFFYDPEKIAIGGGISRQPKLLEYIQKNLDYFYSIYPYSTQHATVVNCRYFNESNLIGAYINFYQ